MPEQGLALGTLDMAAEQEGGLRIVLQQGRELLAACPERQLAKSPAIDRQQVEGNEACLRACFGPERVEVRPAVIGQAHGFPVQDDALHRQALDSLNYPREGLCPVSGVARPQ